jgi:Leucine-rich repeat (LRR) protein
MNIKAMNPRNILVALSLSLQCYLPLTGQEDPHTTAELFFRQRLNESGYTGEFQFETPVRLDGLWIYESEDPAGFVLIRACEGNPVAGYSIRNRFTRNDTVPAPAQGFVRSLSSCPASAFSSSGLKTSYRPVGPMIRSTWSQEGWFNYYCPEDPDGPDGHVYVGCAAVAMGQIVRFYGKFNDFEVTESYSDPRFGTISATVGNCNWTQMEERPITTDTEVSRLLFGLGALMHMNYSSVSSTTSNFNVYDTFKKIKYFNAIRLMRSGTTPEFWVQNFINNIRDYRPVYVSGSSHSFVCDGMDAQGFFHFNLGWYGYGDGYYPLNQVLSLDPAEAMFDVMPYTNNLPVSNFYLDTLSGQRILHWEKNRLTPVDPIHYRVYINDSIWFQTQETLFNTELLPAGNHDLMVSAFYPQGESCWAGPIRHVVAGSAVAIPDAGLRSAILEELLREGIPVQGNQLTTNQLTRISRLEVNQPVADLSGLENCNKLQVLIIDPGTAVSLDLSPIARLNRLKWIELSNISGNMSLLTGNKRLIHLGIRNCNDFQPEFLLNLTELQELVLSGMPIPDPQIFSSLRWLKKLTLSDCEITNPSFVQDLTDLECLDLSGNLLTRFRLQEKLPEIAELNLSRNQLSDLFFLEFVPGLVRLNVSANQLNRFVTGLNFKFLKELSIDSNSIDTLAFAVPATSMRRLTASGNRIRNIGRLASQVPSITHLNLSRNRITELWTGSLQLLEYLDISDNQLSLADDIPANPLLSHVDLSGNRIADVYPVYHHNTASGIQYLDLRGNPLSEETFTRFLPKLKEEITTLMVADSFQPLSPGEPVPPRNQPPAAGPVNLGWKTGTLPDGGYYEIYTGSSRADLKPFATTGIQSFTVDAMPDRPFYWRVRTVLPDTSFLSGLFHFVTSRPLELPYEEGFEDYPSFAYFTEKSPFWLRASGDASSPVDGRVDPYRRNSGRQALKLANSAEIRLPLGHLYQSSLYINMQLLIGNGCIGSVRFRNLNGTDINLWFKSNGRCDLAINGVWQTEIPYPESAWFPLQLNLYGQGNGIWLKIGPNLFPIDWEFTGETAHLDEIVLASKPGPNWPSDGQALFHADDISIKATGSMVIETLADTGGQIRIYPNPAAERLYIEIPVFDSAPSVTLFNISGQVISANCLPAGPGRWCISTENTFPGLYFIRIISGGQIFTSKFVVSK